MLATFEGVALRYRKSFVCSNCNPNSVEQLWLSKKNAILSFGRLRIEYRIFSVQQMIDLEQNSTQMVNDVGVTAMDREGGARVR